MINFYGYERYVVHISLYISLSLACSDSLTDDHTSEDKEIYIIDNSSYDMAINYEINAGTNTMNAGTDTINAGTNTINAGTNTINAGTDTINAGTNTMNAGTDTINAGTNTMNAGTNTMNSDNVCTHWNETMTALGTLTWTGSTNECNAGQIDMTAQQNVVLLTNFYRSLAQLSPITLAIQDQDSLQACALMMDANHSLSHQPPASWNCYTAEGAQKASRSNLASINALDAVSLYMIDMGNQTTMGHRRWIMSKGLQTIGIGSTASYSCMEVLHSNRQAGWVAYPPPGEFPIQVLRDRWASIDDTGWTIQMNGIRVMNPQVSITADGQLLPVNVVELLPNYGSESALNIIPQGWISQAGVSYEVVVTGLSEEIRYTVDMVDCSGG